MRMADHDRPHHMHAQPNSKTQESLRRGHESNAWWRDSHRRTRGSVSQCPRCWRPNRGGHLHGLTPRGPQHRILVFPSCVGFGKLFCGFCLALANLCPFSSSSPPTTGQAARMAWRKFTSLSRWRLRACPLCRKGPPYSLCISSTGIISEALDWKA